MNTEEKARAYDEALERVKPLYEWAKKDDSPMWSTYEYLFPQLAESEDERIRKHLIDIVETYWGKTNEPGKAADLAYLEKQKEAKWYPSEGEMGVLYKLCYLSNQITDEDDTELTRLYQDLKREYFNGHSFENMFSNEKQKEPHFTKRNALFDKCVENCDPEIMKRVSDEVDEMLEKEQKPVQSDVEREYVRTLKSLISDFLRGKEEVDREYYQQIYDWLDGRHIGQKPAEWILPEEFEEAVYKVANFISPFDSQEELRKVSHRFAEQLLSLAKKELDKPAEWSEEDNIGWDEAFACVTKTERAAKDEGELQNAVTAEKWLKEIKFKYYVHPNREWSEDDEETLKDIIAGLEATKQLTYRHEPSGRACYNKWIAWLKSLRPQPHWKPSEEQMRALRLARSFVVDDFGKTTTVSETLKELEEQLKKL